MNPRIRSLVLSIADLIRGLPEDVRRRVQRPFLQLMRDASAGIVPPAILREEARQLLRQIGRMTQV